MFQVFRRHQKRLLAVVTILAMFAFVFPLGSTYFSGSDGTRKSNVEVKDEIYGRQITNLDIDRAKWDRHVANTFVHYSLMAVNYPGANQATTEAVAFSRFGFGPWDDEDAIKDAIRLVHKADEFQIKVSDDVVRTWVKELTGDKLSTKKFQEVVARVARMEQGITPEILFDILRNQLRIQQARDLVIGRVPSGAHQVTPYEAWQFYRRLNEKLGLEVITVAVANFADNIDDPGDDALRELYGKYVGQLPDPSSPEPGFKEPRKMNLQYASVNLDDFRLALTAELEITEDEIQQYYESHKEMYRVKSPEEIPSIGPAEVPEKPKIEPPKPEEGDQDKAAPGKDEGEPKKESPEKPSPGESSSPKQENSNEDIELDDPPVKSGEQSGSKSQETKDAAKAEAKSSLDDPAKKAPDGNDEPKPQKSEAGQDPAKDPPAKDDAKESQKPDPETTKQDETATQTEKQDEPPQYKPLEEVTNEIRDLIRKDKARAELTKRLEQIGRVVGDFGVKVYSRAKDKYDVEKETKPDVVFVSPVPPNFSESANELGLQFAETGPVPLNEDFLKLPIVGEAMEIRGGRFGRSVPEVMSSNDLYEPMEFRTFKDEYASVWKVADVPEKEPDFGDVREQVLAAYRTIKARELAKEHASKLADLLRDLGGDLEKFRERNPGIETLAIGPIALWSNAPMFSMNMMGRQGRVHPTDLPGLQFPTDELRTNAFKLKEDEVTVASNQPEDTFYVVLLTKREPASREDFARSKALVEDQVLQEQLEKATKNWLQALRDESKRRKGKAPAGN